MPNQAFITLLSRRPPVSFNLGNGKVIREHERLCLPGLGLSHLARTRSRGDYREMQQFACTMANKSTDMDASFCFRVDRCSFSELRKKQRF